MRWDRVTTEPAEFIFPEKVIRERDIKDCTLREIESKGTPALSTHCIELMRGNETLADSHKTSRRWTVHIKGGGYRFSLTKAEVFNTLMGLI